MELEDYLDGVDDTAIAADHGRPAPIPAGEYMLELTEKDFKDTKDGTGTMLNCKFRVVEGEFEGRLIFTNFNIKNRSEQAQRIGIGQLKGFCIAAGVPWDVVKADTSSLLHQPFLATVGFSKTTDAYPDPRNEIKAFKAPAGVAPAGKAPAAAPKPSQASSAPGKNLPWKKSQAA